METVQVQIPCPCVGTPHPDGDTVGLRPKLGLREGVAVQTALLAVPGIREGKADTAETTGILSEAYVLAGVCEWTLVDPLGAALPVTRQNVVDRLLSDFAAAGPVADKADELYMAAVVLPLVREAESLSRNGQTGGGTSAPNGHRPKRPKRSRPSSTSTTGTGVTVTTTG